MSTIFWLDLFSVATKLVTCFSVLISTPIYISILVFIQRQGNKPPYNSPFYSCFIALGVIDLCCYWLYMLKKFNFWDWRLDFLLPPDTANSACAFFYCCIWATGMAQWQLNILISLNRFVALMFPEVYRKFWTVRLNRLYIALVLVICTAATVRILWLPVGIKTIMVPLENGENISKLAGPLFLDKLDGDFYGIIWKCHNYVLLGICLFCYVPMFVKISRLKIQDQNAKLEWEIKMLYTLVSLLVVNLLYATFLLSRDLLTQYFGQDYGRYSEWSLLLLADVYDLHNPYNLLVTSRQIRWGAFPFLLFRQRFNKPTPMPLHQLVGGNHLLAPPNIGVGVRQQRVAKAAPGIVVPAAVRPPPPAQLKPFKQISVRSRSSPSTTKTHST